MNKIPIVLKIAAFDITVEDLPHGNELNGWGDFSALHQRIRLDKTSLQKLPRKYADSFLHETLHAVCWVYGVQDEDKEERVVTTIATGLAQVFRDNPEVLPWIEEKLNGCHEGYSNG
tara:strand:- start:823 stop:1173 length:351 start_codon:yes stop_codon:yes gene_type:complete